MLTGLRRVASIVTLLAFSLSSGLTCAGWKPTPEARRACCQSGGCHRATEARSSDTASGAPHDLTQAAADGCCAASESGRSESAPSSSSTAVAASMTLAVLHAWTSAAALADVRPAIVSTRWHDSVPRPPGHVPKHLLLSVFLV